MAKRTTQSDRIRWARTNLHNAGTAVNLARRTLANVSKNAPYLRTGALYNLRNAEARQEQARYELERLTQKSTGGRGH